MIIGIGIDSVEIHRFSLWHAKSRMQLLRIFSEQEIEYCLSNPALSAQRFAVRFAAREALYKAMSARWPKHTIPFLTLCRATTIIKNRAPMILLDWVMLQSYGVQPFGNPIIYLSLTHTQHIATAFIILEIL